MPSCVTQESPTVAQVASPRSGPQPKGYGLRGLSRRVLDHFKSMPGVTMTPLQVSIALKVPKKNRITVAQLTARLSHRGQLSRIKPGRYVYGLIETPLFPEVIFEREP